MKVCVTGKLAGFSRKEAKAAVEGLGCEFSAAVTYDTNYLVAGSLKTSKAKKALLIGVEVITEAEFEEFIEAGEFPENKHPDRPKRTWTNNFPDLVWRKIPSSEVKLQDIEYQDSDGVVTIRTILPIAEAEYLTKRGLTVQYLKAEDKATKTVKWFRFDRILSVS